MSGDIPAGSEQIILATASYDHTIKIWQTHSGICQRTMHHAESQVNMLEITPDRKLLAAAGYQHIRMFDLASNNPNAVINYECISKNVTSVGFQVDNKFMYSGGEDGKVRIWDLKSSTCPHVFAVHNPVTCVRLHPDQTKLFIGDQGGNIFIWDLRDDYHHRYIPDENNMILDLAIDPMGTHCAAVNSKGKCFIWTIDVEITMLSPKKKFDSHARHALKCKFSPDSKLLITTSADQSARIWDTEDYSLVQELKHNNQRWVWDTAFSADSQYAFTGSSDGIARLWNVKTGSLEREYSGHQKSITAIAFWDVAV